jgi:hypothetical protein
VNQDHLAAPSEKARAAVRTLDSLGFTYHDAELWKPPLGQRAAPSDGEREAFEAWFEPDEQNRAFVVRERVGESYAGHAIYLNGCWQGWQAASAARSAEIQQLREALKETAQSLAWLSFGECRGFSDNLLPSNQALELARAALKEPQQ